MPHITIDGSNVQIQLTGLDKLWAVHGSLGVPLAHVTSARVEDENGWQHMWRKLIGTSMPGIKIAGTFFMPGGLAFLDYGDGRNCLVLETRHERYKYVIVQTDEDQDVNALAAEINRLAGHT